MRVSDNQRYQGFVPQYQSLLSRQIDIQRQIASGQKILRASDDTAGAARAQLYMGELSTLSQDLRNIDEAKGETDIAADAVQRSLDMMQRVRELAVQAGNPTLDNTARTNISQELEQILKTMAGLGTQSHRGQMVFSGTLTDQAAFVTADTNADGKIDTVTYQGNYETRAVEISPGRTSDYSVLGSNAGGGESGVFIDWQGAVEQTNVFKSIIDLRNAVDTNNLAAVSTVSIPQLEKDISHLTVAMARIGGVQSRMETSVTLNEDVSETTQLNLSKIRDTDLAEASTQYAQLETSYKAALNMGARIMQMSLLDYVR